MLLKVAGDDHVHWRLCDLQMSFPWKGWGCYSAGQDLGRLQCATTGTLQQYCPPVQWRMDYELFISIYSTGRHSKSAISLPYNIPLFASDNSQTRAVYQKRSGLREMAGLDSRRQLWMCKVSIRKPPTPLGEYHIRSLKRRPLTKRCRHCTVCCRVCAVSSLAVVTGRVFVLLQPI